MTRNELLLLTPLARFSDHALLALRLLTGGFLVHAMWPNISDAATMKEVVGYFAANGFTAPELMAPLSAWAQFFIGIALISGLLTRWAGLLLAFNFIVGVVMVHWDQTFREWWPAIVLVAIGLVFAALGGGRLALDRLIERRRGDDAR